MSAVGTKGNGGKFLHKKSIKVGELIINSPHSTNVWSDLLATPGLLGGDQMSVVKLLVLTSF